MSHFVRRAVNSKRPKVEPIRNLTLFEREKLEKAAKLTSELEIARPFSLPGILLGTSAFTIAGCPTAPMRFIPFYKALLCNH